MAILGCREKVKHPERHFFEAEELRHILEGSGLEIVEMASAPALACGLRKQMDLIEKNEIFRGPRITLFNTSLRLGSPKSTHDVGQVSPVMENSRQKL